jgi:SAM-dependent methyltransferase
MGYIKGSSGVKVVSSPSNISSARMKKMKVRQTFKNVAVLTFLLSVSFTVAFCPSNRYLRPHSNSVCRALLPQENPNLDPSAVSNSGVRYATVLSGIHKLFPPSDLERRNALSRTDGYWPYIQKGDMDPPKQFTYGEFDFYFFAQLLDRVIDDYRDKVFCDVGSGTGRLVLAAAALHPELKLAKGVELLETIHSAAVENLNKCQRDTDKNDTQASLVVAVDEETGAETRIGMSPIQFEQGSFEDPYVYFGDVDVLFMFSSCMGQTLMKSLAHSIGRQCKPGATIITTEFMLPLTGTVPPFESDSRIPHGDYELELVERVDGWCWLTGGESTAYIHKVKTSLLEVGAGPLKPPEKSIEDQCLEVVRALEAGELGNIEQFKRGVYNNMVFQGLPERFLPDIGQ